MARAIQRWVDDPDAARAAGEAGRKGISTRFSWDARAAELEVMYEAVLRAQSA